jgi:hypothetical protein
MEIIIERPCRYSYMFCKFQSEVCKYDSMCTDCGEKARRKKLEEEPCPVMKKAGFSGDFLRCGDFVVKALLPHHVVCTEDECPRSRIKKLQEMCGKSMLNKISDQWEIIAAIDDAFREAA